VNVYVYLFGLIPSATVGLIAALIEIATIMRRARFVEPILLLPNVVRVKEDGTLEEIPVEKLPSNLKDALEKAREILSRREVVEYLYTRASEYLRSRGLKPLSFSYKHVLVKSLMFFSATYIVWLVAQLVFYAPR
jgi:hypothetical protein